MFKHLLAVFANNVFRQVRYPDSRQLFGIGRNVQGVNRAIRFTHKTCLTVVYTRYCGNAVCLAIEYIRWTYRYAYIAGNTSFFV